MTRLWWRIIGGGGGVEDKEVEEEEQQEGEEVGKWWGEARVAWYAYVHGADFAAARVGVGGAASRAG